MSEQGSSASGPDFTKRPPDERGPEPGASGWGGQGEPAYGQPAYGQPPSAWEPSSPPPGQQGGGYGQQPPYGGYGQPAYGPAGSGGQPAYAPGGWAGAPQTDGTAIAALVCAIAAWVMCPIVLAVVALVLAHNSDRAIAASGGQRTGHGLNTAARWVAWVHLAVFLLVIVGLLAAGVFFATSSSTSTY